MPELLRALDVDPDTGLSQREASQRLKQHGANRLHRAETASPLAILVNQFKSLVIAILAVAAVLSFVMGDLMQGMAILAAILINAAIGFATEWKAVRSMEALRRLGTVRSRVRRGGEARMVKAEALVPGDVVVLEAGDVVTADLRLIEANGLTCDESALTGESVPVSKQTDAVAEDAPLAERPSMAFKGTAVTDGSGSGVVVATGMTTELGAVAQLAEQAEQEVTPLERRLDQLGRRLVILTLAVAALVAGLGWLGGKDLVVMVETAIALAVAAVPEGLPIVATVALARGMWRMARRNALVERLAAVETLGSANVVFTDKTGTLTENRMGLALLALPGTDTDIDWQTVHAPSETSPLVPRLLQTGILCTNAELADGPDLRTRAGKATGDPLEVALLTAGAELGLERDRLLQDAPEEREVSFDSDTKMMATFHRDRDGVRIAVKGAPEAVLAAATRIAANGEDRPLTDQDREAWKQRIDRLAEQGLRVLAFAERHTDQVDVPPYENLTLLGLAGLADPPRADAAEAVSRCQTAGIQVIMVTGDQPVTAAAIARQVGITSNDRPPLQGQALPELDRLSQEEHADLRRRTVFARVSPAQKLDLVRLWQETGAVVAMTGDGVNDAPALKKADVGIAMGQRGTDVARETADIVLKDDAFPTIVAAIEQGRAIFENIRRFIIFLLSGNLAEVLAIGFCALTAAPLPLLPLQILYINLVLDVFPALALGVGEASSGIMQRPPRDPKEPILTRRHWAGTGLWGLLIAAVVTSVFFFALGPLKLPESEAVTIAFLSFALARLWHAFNMRDAGPQVFANTVVANRWLWLTILLCLALIAAAAFLPGLTAVLQVVPVSLTGWTLIVGGSLIPLVIGQVMLTLWPTRERPHCG